MHYRESGILSLEQYLLYGMILSMATYAIPFIRIGLEVYAFPVGGLFIPASLFLILLRCFYLRRYVLNNVLGLSLFLLYFSIPISSLFSMSIETERIFKLSIFMLLPFLFTNVLDHEQSVKSAVRSIVAVGVVLCFYGFYGYLTGNIGEDAEKLWWWNYARYWGIHYSTSSRNSDTYYIMIPFIIVSVFLFYGTTRSRFLKLSLGIISFLFAAAILLSFSRGAWISILAVIAIFFFIMWREKGISKWKIRGTLLLIVIVGLFGIVGLILLNRFDMYYYFIGKTLSIIFPNQAGFYLKEIVSNQDRIQLLKATFSIILSHPLGIGPDNLKHFLGAYDLGGKHAENIYLHILSENGVFGFLGYLLFILYPIIKLFKRVRTEERNWFNISMFLVSLYLCFSYLFNVEIYSLYVWIVHSIIWSSITLQNSAGTGKYRYNMGGNRVGAKGR
jgi:O-antigen ligase